MFLLLQLALLLRLSLSLCLWPSSFQKPVFKNCSCSVEDSAVSQSLSAIFRRPSVRKGCVDVLASDVFEVGICSDSGAGPDPSSSHSSHRVTNSTLAHAEGDSLTSRSTSQRNVSVFKQPHAVR